MRNIEELRKLEDYLIIEGFNFSWHEYKEAHQIIVYDDKGRRSWDAIISDYSYGSQLGLMEVMGDILGAKNIVMGFLTAEAVIEMIESEDR